MSVHPFSTVLFLNHAAGSNEQAIAHRRDAYGALEALGFEVVGAKTVFGSTAHHWAANAVMEGDDDE
jgi:ankyrin repeat protein